MTHATLEFESLSRHVMNNMHSLHSRDRALMRLSVVGPHEIVSPWLHCPNFKRDFFLLRSKSEREFLKRLKPLEDRCVVSFKSRGKRVRHYAAAAAAAAATARHSPQCRRR